MIDHPKGGENEVRTADLPQAGQPRGTPRGRGQGADRRVPGLPRRPALPGRRAPAAHGNGDDGARGRRRSEPDHRRSLRRHQGGARRLLRVRRVQPGRGARGSAANSCDPARRRGRGAPARRDPRGGGVLIEQVFRREWGRVMASLVGLLGDMDLAEEAAQEAFAIAAERWPRDGVPQHPVAWLVATGRHRAVDRVRRERTLESKTRLLETDRPAATMHEIDLDDSTIPDERLELIFMCCHPALAVDAQVALTLRALGGLTTEEIARAFLVAEQTMKRRLSRAKAKIKATAIPFAVPADPLLPDRLAAVLAVVYLIFNQAYPDRGDLAAEAIRLGRLLAELMPDESEVHGLLALMLLHDSRREARVADGELVPLDEQDRSFSDRPKVEAGR